MLIRHHALEAIDFWYQHFGRRMIKRAPIDDNKTRQCESCGRTGTTHFRMGGSYRKRYKCPACYSYTCGAPKLGLHSLVGSAVLVRPNRKSRLITRPINDSPNWVINKEEEGSIFSWIGGILLNPPPPPFLLVHLGRNRDINRLKVTHSPDTLHYCKGDILTIDHPAICHYTKAFYPIRKRWQRLYLLQERITLERRSRGDHWSHPEFDKLEQQNPELLKTLHTFPNSQANWMALFTIFRYLQHQESQGHALPL